MLELGRVRVKLEKSWGFDVDATLLGDVIWFVTTVALPDKQNIKINSNYPLNVTHNFICNT